MEKKKSKKIKYKLSLITYIDILGFSSLVNSDKTAKEIHEQYQKLKYLSKKDFENDDLQVFHFSDCIVRIWPLHNVKKNVNFTLPKGLLKLNPLGIEIISISYIQLSMLEKGIFLRGAITIGDIFQNKDEIFGPGLVKAYNLENNISIYPRVIIDPTIFEFIRKLEKQFNYDPNLYVFGIGTDLTKSDLCLDNDGIWFVDYLRWLRKPTTLGADDYEFLEVLDNHKNAIIKNIYSFKKFDKICHKYSWLIKYHNNVVEECGKKYFEAMDCDIYDFRIRKDEIPSFFEL